MTCYNASKIGAGNPKWRGGKIIVGGYVYVYSPQHPNKVRTGYVCEHRLVMERHLGRLLLSSEAVHHKDGDTMNNTIDNLELCESNGKHYVQHHAVRAANGKFASHSA